MTSQPSKSKEWTGAIAAVLLVGFLCGCIGYMIPTGVLFDFKKRKNRHRRHLNHQPMPKEEYTRKARTGFWVGAAVGAGFTIYFFARPTRKD